MKEGRQRQKPSSSRNGVDRACHQRHGRQEDGRLGAEMHRRILATGPSASHPKTGRSVRFSGGWHLGVGWGMDELGPVPDEIMDAYDVEGFRRRGHRMVDVMADWLGRWVRPTEEQVLGGIG